MVLHKAMTTTSTGTKKRKYADKDENEDRISQLPDDILTSIISRLTFEEATATSMISTRWRHLFEYISHLNFPPFKPIINDSNRELVREKLFPDYVERVNRFLDSHKGSQVKEFRLWMHCLEGATIERWLEFALSKDTEIIDINLDFVLSVTWRNYSIRLSDLIATRPLPGLRCLKELSLSRIRVDDGDIEPLLSNTPLLESLSILWSAGFENILIVGCSVILKHLDISYAVNLKSIEIGDMINLVSLRCYGRHTYKYEMRLYNVPKLTEFRAGPHGDRAIAELLPRIPSCIRDQLQLLKLSIHDPMACLGMLPKLVNIKHLEVEVKLSSMNYFIFGIIPLIEACCLLETLELKFSWWDIRRIKKEDIVTPPNRPLSPVLKKVKLLGYYGCKIDREFALYLLKNVVDLRELIVEPYHVGGRRAAARARRHLGSAIDDSVNLVIMKCPKS